MQNDINMPAFYVPVSIQLEELAMYIAQECSTEDIRKFVECLCDEAQELEIDEAILADRFRKVSEFYGPNADEGYEELDMQELCKRYPVI